MKVSVLPIELYSSKKPNPGTVTTTTTSTSDRHRLRAKLKSYLDKKSSVKFKRYNHYTCTVHVELQSLSCRKKGRNPSKISKNKYRKTSSTSSSDSVEWKEATVSTIETKERKGKKTHYRGRQSEDKQRQRRKGPDETVRSTCIGSSHGNLSRSDDQHKYKKRVFRT